jgi:hypothetical protein
MAHEWQTRISRAAGKVIIRVIYTAVDRRSPFAEGCFSCAATSTAEARMIDAMLTACSITASSRPALAARYGLG